MTGCVSNGHLTTLNTTDNEGIVAGRIEIYYNDENVTNNSTILFNEFMWGTYPFQPDEIGFIVTKLPVGDNFFARISYKNFFINITREHTLFNVIGNNKISYIGNITIDWEGPDYKINTGVMFGAVGGALGALADQMNPDGSIDIYVEDKENEIVDYIHQTFGHEMEMVNVLIPVPDISQKNSKEIIEIPSDYLTFNINDGRKVYGKLKGIKKKEIYVEDGKILYIIKKDLLLSILENDVDVTEMKLNQSQFNPINFNAYAEFIDIR